MVEPRRSSKPSWGDDSTTEASQYGRLKSRMLRSVADPEARSGAVALADQLIASATNFVTGVIIGRVCSQEEFGLYMLGLSLVFIAMRLQLALISTPYMVFIPKMGSPERERLTGSTLVHQFGLSVLAIAALLLAGLVLATGIGPRGLSAVVWALVCTIAFILLRDFIRNVCFSNLDFMTAFFLDVGISIIQIGTLLLLVWFGTLSARSTFLVIGAASGLAGVAWFIHARKSIELRMQEIVPALRRSWIFGRWIFASAFLWEANLSLYPWILTLFHGTGETGGWAACFGVVALGNPILLGMQNYLGPIIAHSYVSQERDLHRKFVYRSSLVFSLLILPISLIIGIFGDSLVTTVYGHKYSGYGPVVLFLAVGLLLGPLRFGLSRALFAMEHSVAEFVTNFVPLVVLMVLGVWLVKSFSVVGVAAGILVGDILVTGAKYIVFEVLVRSRNGYAE